MTARAILNQSTSPRNRLAVAVVALISTLLVADVEAQPSGFRMRHVEPHC